jgi:hypothetical protein
LIFQFVKTAVEWAPATVLSHLQEYINTMTHDTGYTHTGVTFAVECILCFSGQSDQVSFVDYSLIVDYLVSLILP